MERLLESLERLSEAAYEALPLLEKHDYRKEADDYANKKLEVDLMPKLLQDIVGSMLMYCAPIEHNGKRTPDAALLNADNMRYFTENLNISGDWRCLRQLNHIDIEPIEDVKNILEQIGLIRQAHLLENVCNFAENLRSHSRSHSLRPASIHNVPVNIQVTLSEDELKAAELQAAQAFKDFCTIFRPGVLNSAQKRALYDTLSKHIKDNPNGHPHLTITAAILLLMKRPLYGKPLQGQFHTIRKTVFTSLGLPDTTSKNYKATSLKKDVSPTLYKYIEPATELLSTALGTTR